MDWLSCRELPPLEWNVVHVWRLALGDQTPPPAAFHHLLSADEVARAARFVFDKDRQSYVRCRGTLRILLGRYLDLAPERVEFAYNRFGKPGIALPDRPSPLQFNVSHSGDWALIAVTREHSIGVDVEQVRQLDGLDALARRSLSQAEWDVYQRLTSEQRTPAFFHAWTRKEAFIKACGEGLSHPLADFDVAFAPTQSAQLLRISGDRDAARRWTLAALEPEPGYVGAVAIECPAARVQWLAG